MNYEEAVKKAQAEIEEDITKKAVAEIKELKLELYAARKVVKNIQKKIKETEERLTEELAEVGE